MEKHEAWAVYIALGFLVAPFLTLGVTMGLSEILRERYFASYLVETALGQSARVLVAIWLFITARRDGNSPWVWSAMALAFSLLGAVLYFVIRASEQYRAATTSPVTSSA